MSRPHARVGALAAVLACAAAPAAAQPLDPYGPPPAGRPATPTPPPSSAPVDPYASAPVAPPPADDMSAAVAVALLERARALAASGELAGARLLAAEAAAQDPSGPTGAAARALADELARKLAPLPPPPVEAAPVEAAPPVVAPPVVLDQPLPPPPRAAGRTVLGVYGALGGAAVGAGLAGDRSDGQVAGFALGGAAVGGLAGYYVARRQGWTATRAHLIGAGVVWGAAAGGAFADVVTGVEGTTSAEVAAGTGLGALGGALAGVALSADPRLTAGDAALIDSLSAWGLVAGLTTGVAINPPEGEAFSLNATLGIAVGHLVGHVAARRVEVSGRRLARVNALALAGAGVPMLLWQATRNNTDTEADPGQAWGLLATAGLVGGAYLGFRWTRGMDRRAETTARLDPAAPPALWQRSADGAWSLGGLAVTPVRHGQGAALTLAAGRW